MYTSSRTDEIRAMMSSLFFFSFTISSTWLKHLVTSIPYHPRNALLSLTSLLLSAISIKFPPIFLFDICVYSNPSLSNKQLLSQTLSFFALKNSHIKQRLRNEFPFAIHTHQRERGCVRILKSPGGQNLRLSKLGDVQVGSNSIVTVTVQNNGDIHLNRIDKKKKYMLKCLGDKGIQLFTSSKYLFI